jgi:hypothetical protein
MVILTGSPNEILLDSWNAKAKDLFVSIIDICPPFIPHSCETIAKTVNGKVDLIISLLTLALTDEFLQFFNDVVYLRGKTKLYLSY